jgi:hypothetical protein
MRSDHVERLDHLEQVEHLAVFQLVFDIFKSPGSLNPLVLKAPETIREIKLAVVKSAVVRSMVLTSRRPDVRVGHVDDATSSLQFSFFAAASRRIGRGHNIPQRIPARHGSLPNVWKEARGRLERRSKPNVAIIAPA